MTSMASPAQADISMRSSLNGPPMYSMSTPGRAPLRADRTLSNADGAESVNAVVEIAHARGGVDARPPASERAPTTGGRPAMRG
jgi:hypothetical protein